MKVEKDITELVRRYEDRMASGQSIYFDADEFIDLADYFEQNDDFETSIEIITRALEIHPGNTGLIIRRARYWVFDAEYDKALSVLDKLSGEQDMDCDLLRVECLLHLGQMDEADRVAQNILSYESEFLDHALAELGFNYLDVDQYEQAIIYFNRSLELNPLNADVMSDLGYAYELVGDFDGAISAYNKVLDQDPYSYVAWFNIGRIYSMTNEYEKAIDAFDFALTIDDSDSDLLKLKVHCLMLSNRGEEAIAILKDLSEENPNDSALYYLLAECYFTLNMYDDALQCLTIYEELEGDTLNGKIKKASILLEQNEFEKALEVINSCYEENMLVPELNMLLGEIYFKQDDLEKSDVFYMRAYEYDPDNSHIVERLSLINIRKGNYEKALGFTKELLTMEPYSKEVKLRLILLYFELDDNEEFDSQLNSLTDDEMKGLFTLIYNQSDSEFSREEFVKYLTEARECRILFKNLKY